MSFDGVKPKLVFNILDYGGVADGVTSNTTAVGLAGAAATAAGGGVVWFPPGPYAFGSTVTITAGVVWECAYGSATISSGYTGTTSPFQMGAGSSLIGFIITLGTSTGGHVKPNTNCLIRNCTFTKAGRVCVYQDGNDNSSNCVIEGCMGIATSHLYYMPASRSGVNNYRIINNTLMNSIGTIFVTVSSMTGFIIEGNTNYNSSYTSGCLVATTVAMTRMTIANNYVYGGNRGIYISSTGAHDITITGNVLEGSVPGTPGSNDCGIYMDAGTNVTITGNVITNFDDSGIQIDTSSGTSSLISNNVVTHNRGRGIYISTSNDTIVTDNLVANNTLSGIRINNTNRAITNGNVIYSNGAYGIEIVDSTLGMDTGANVMYNNTSDNLYVSNPSTGVAIPFKNPSVSKETVTVTSNSYNAYTIAELNTYANGTLYVSIKQGSNWRVDVWTIFFDGTTLTKTLVKTVQAGATPISGVTLAVSGTLLQVTYAQTIANGTTATLNASLFGMLLRVA